MAVVPWRAVQCAHTVSIQRVDACAGRVPGDQGEVYVDSDEPVLSFRMKRDAMPGAVGVYASNLAPTYFANFTYRETAPAIRGTPKPFEPALDGTVMSWSVSSAFDEAAVVDKGHLTDAHKSGLTWQALPAESTSITNLASITAIGEGQNTVFARFIIDAEREQTKPVRFGYSDRVRVYLNDRLIYSGNNGYVTRDYRYLGTIGLFDEVHVPLEQGENEIWFAVSESFGGWGLLAQIDGMDGIRLFH